MEIYAPAKAEEEDYELSQGGYIRWSEKEISKLGNNGKEHGGDPSDKIISSVQGHVNTGNIPKART